MVVIALVIFGGMYFKYNGKHRSMVITLCTVIPITSLALIVFFVFLRKKIEAPQIPSTLKDQISALD